MNSIFKICSTGDCAVSIVGLEQDSSQYLTERQVSIRNYTWNDTVTLNVVIKVSSKEEDTFEDYEVVPHTDIDSDEFTLQKDGLYKVLHIIVPTKEWMNYVRERDESHFDDYSLVYFFSNDKFYKFSLGTIEEVSVNEIIEANLDETTCIKNERYTFNLCHLKECFFKLCKYLLDNLPCECTNAKDFKQDILNRDIIWMALNVIQYLLQREQYFKAQSILEQIDTCWGICGNLDKKTILGGYDCGCNH